MREKQYIVLNALAANMPDHTKVLTKRGNNFKVKNYNSKNMENYVKQYVGQAKEICRCKEIFQMSSLSKRTAVLSLA